MARHSRGLEIAEDAHSAETETFRTFFTIHLLCFKYCLYIYIYFFFVLLSMLCCINVFYIDYSSLRLMFLCSNKVVTSTILITKWLFFRESEPK